MFEAWPDFWVNPAMILSMEATGPLLRITIDAGVSRVKEFDSSDDARKAARNVAEFAAAMLRGGA